MAAGHRPFQPVTAGCPVGAELEADTIAASVAAGRLSAVEVHAAARRRHEAIHARLNALVQPRFAESAAEAAAVDARPGGPLAGVPVSVKECFPVRGLRTPLGIRRRFAAVDAADAEIVTRLRDAGAVIVGKANVPQAMYLHETANPVFGRTSHPLASDRGPGGSSGGDAAVVAAGVVPLGVGNDVAGSLRQPAHVCGIAAIMPRSTVLGEGGACDTLPGLRAVRPRAGFLARSVADLARACQAVGAVAQSPRPLRRVGWWDSAGPISPSAAIRRGVAEAVGRLAAAGVEAVSLDGGVAEAAAWLHLAILSADGGGDIRRLFAGERPMRNVGRLLRLAGMPRWARPAVARAARLLGRRLEAKGLLATGPRDEAGLALLLEARAALAARLAEAMTGCDAVVCPVSALPALRHGAAARLVLAAAPCFLANLCDLAAGAVPVTTVRPGEEAGRAASWDPVLRAAAATDRGSRGLPVGVQVIAPPGGDEATVLKVMRLIEQPLRRG
jgi:fatty acid amide hydrolase